MKILLIFTCCLTLVFSCKNADPTEGFQTLDLMQDGLPIKIKAPEGAVVVSDNLGFIQDVTIKGDGNYYVQIQGGSATTFDAKVVKNNLLTDLKNAKYFSKIIEENETGFIYEKDLGGDNLNYDFRFVKIQGDKEYVFQRGLVGQYTLEEIKTMYNAVQ